MVLLKYTNSYNTLMHALQVYHCVIPRAGKSCLLKSQLPFYWYIEHEGFLLPAMFADGIFQNYNYQSISQR